MQLIDYSIPKKLSSIFGSSYLGYTRAHAILDRALWPYLLAVLMIPMLSIPNLMRHGDVRFELLSMFVPLGMIALCYLAGRYVQHQLPIRQTSAHLMLLVTLTGLLLAVNMKLILSHLLNLGMDAATLNLLPLVALAGLSLHPLTVDESLASSSLVIGAHYVVTQLFGMAVSHEAWALLCGGAVMTLIAQQQYLHHILKATHDLEPGNISHFKRISDFVHFSKILADHYASIDQPISLARLEWKPRHKEQTIDQLKWLMTLSGLIREGDLLTTVDVHNQVFILFQRCDEQGSFAIARRLLAVIQAEYPEDKHGCLHMGIAVKHCDESIASWFGRAHQRLTLSEKVQHHVISVNEHEFKAAA